MERDWPFFVVGVPRSGTTLVRVALDRHPDVAVPPESHFLPSLWSQRGRYSSRGEVTDVPTFLDALQSHPRFRRWDLPVAAVADELAAMERITVEEALAAPFRAYAHVHGKRRWADKTPRYAGHLPLLGRLFPSAKFVHVIRDGRNVALSIVGMERLHRHPVTAAFGWSRTIRRVRRDVARAGLQRRYIELRYEDLLEDQETWLRQVCRFVDLEFSDRMLRHDDAVARLPAEARRLHTRLALPPTKGLRDWRRDMAPTDLAEIEATVGRTLSDLGYPLAQDRVTVGARARGWRRIVLFAVGGAYSRRRRRLQAP